MDINKVLTDIETLNFTAIDFETANEHRGSICSIGIATVRKGIIVDRKDYLIKPRVLSFNIYNQNIHGITEKDVLNAPELCDVWERIFPSLNNEILVAHNADFDIDVLRQTTALYNLQFPLVKYMCSQKLAQEAFSDLSNFRLPDVAQYLSLPLDHHNSSSDAFIAAKIAIEAIPKISIKVFLASHEELTHGIRKIASAEKKNTVLDSFNKKKIQSELLKPDLVNAPTDGLFYNKKVVFTGDMKSISRKEAAIVVQKLGGDINTAISGKTEIVIVGEGAGPSKMQKIEALISKGVELRLIYEEEFLKIIDSSKH